MIRLLVIAPMLLSAVPPPPPSHAGIELRASGVSKGTVRALNCVGGAVCSADAGVGTLWIDGGAPISATYVTQTCNASLTAEQCLSALGTGIMISTTGTGVVSTSAPGAADRVPLSDSATTFTWANLCAANAACLSACDDTAGQHINITASHVVTCGTSQRHDVGGASPQVQYNNAGEFAGTPALLIDGGQVLMPMQTTHPAAPLGAYALHYDHTPSTVMPSVPTTLDSALGFSVPVGLLSTFGDNTLVWSCNVVPGYNVSPVGLNGPVDTSIQWNAFVGAWDRTSVLGRLVWVIGSAPEAQAASRGYPVLTSWRGDVAGAGGFIWLARVALHQATPHARWFFGMYPSTSAFANVELSTLTNVFFLGCDNGSAPHANLNVGSNDNTGSVTFSDLGSDFPCRTDDAIYDIRIDAPANGSVIHYDVTRLDVAKHTSGDVSSNLPQNTVQLRWLIETHSADAGSLTANRPVGYFNKSCILSNP